MSYGKRSFLVLTLGLLLTACQNTDTPKQSDAASPRAGIGSQSVAPINPDGTFDERFYDAESITPMSNADIQADVQNKQQAEVNELNGMLKDSVPENDAIAQAILGKGSYTAFDNFLANSADTTIASYMQSFGLGYKTDQIPTLPPSNPNPSPTDPLPVPGPGIPVETMSVGAQAIGDCSPLLPFTDRMILHRAGSQFIFIDWLGRPMWTYKVVWRYDSDNRTSCQPIVGTWGVAGDIGGHMIADNFGGYGGRANLYPQNGNFNVSAWTVFENGVRRCLNTGFPVSPVGLRVSLTYPSPFFGVRPSQVKGEVRLLGRLGVAASAEFDNAVAGGPYGPGRASLYVSKLRSLGCTANVRS